jgi:hypothetical protein
MTTLRNIKDKRKCVEDESYETLDGKTEERKIEVLGNGDGNISKLSFGEVPVVIEKSRYDRESGNLYDLSLTAELEKGSSYYMSDNKEVEWQLSNNKVIELCDGKFIALEEGSVVVKADFNGVTTEKEIIVRDSKPYKIVSKSVIKFPSKGIEYAINATGLLPDGTAVNIDRRAEWSISNEKVAIVDNGLITSIGSGNAVITVKFRGLKRTIFVNVDEAGVGENSIPNATEEARSLSDDGKYEMSTLADEYSVILWDSCKKNKLIDFKIVGQDYDFLWSPDNKKVCISYCGRTWRDFSVINAERQKLIEHSTVNDIINKFKEEKSGIDYELRENRPDPYLEPIQWSPDSKKLLIFYQWTDADNNVQNGNFIYDIETNTVSDLVENKPFQDEGHGIIKIPEIFSW